MPRTPDHRYGPSHEDLARQQIRGLQANFNYSKRIKDQQQALKRKFEEQFGENIIRAGYNYRTGAEIGRRVVLRNGIPHTEGSTEAELRESFASALISELESRPLSEKVAYLDGVLGALDQLFPKQRS